MIQVLATGALTTVQDLGRPGLAALGVSPSGAADRSSHALANRLVGNSESAATLECTLGGLALRFHRDALIAVTGAPVDVHVGGRTDAAYTPLHVHAGTDVRLGTPTHGLRSYLAVRGGIDVPPVLGSRATDLLGAIGPDALTTGTRLTIGATPDHPPSQADVVPPLRIPEVPVLQAIWGPRDDWFTELARDRLASETYTVSTSSNRVGLRLTGSPLTRATDAELPSEAMVAGALQVPPDGQPVLLLADHPVTGGYPVLAVVTDVALAAQLRPGQRLRFGLSRLDVATQCR